MKKKTLVLGASPNPNRYGYKAVDRLHFYGHLVYAFGRKKGAIADVVISDKWPNEDFDTVSLYLNPVNQGEYYNRIIEMKPRRVIFNPGTENPEFDSMLMQNGIETEQACTLVLLSLGRY